MNDLTIYDTLAESWWQAGSKLHMLARMNPARFVYFDTIVEHWQGLRVLDLGCGGYFIRKQFHLPAKQGGHALGNEEGPLGEQTRFGNFARGGIKS